MEITLKSTTRTTIRPNNPVIGLHPEKTITERSARTLMFAAALFTITGTWKIVKDREALCAAVHGVTKSWTQLSN